MSGLILPMLLAALCCLAVYKGVDVFAALTDGARKGLGAVAAMLPALIVLLTAVRFLNASGVAELVSQALAAPLAKLGVPSETVPLLLLRPFSGSGALALGSDIISSCGADSFAGRCAAVMLGSSETTFYVASVYFAAAGAHRCGRAIPAALAADLTAFAAAAAAVKLVFG